MPSAVFATFIWSAQILLQERLYWSRHLDFMMHLDFIHLVCNSTYPVVDWEKRNSAFHCNVHLVLYGQGVLNFSLLDGT